MDNSLTPGNYILKGTDKFYLVYYNEDNKKIVEEYQEINLELIKRIPFTEKNLVLHQQIYQAILCSLKKRLKDYADSLRDYADISIKDQVVK